MKSKNPTKQQTNAKIISLLKQRFQGEDGIEHYQQAREQALAMMQMGCLKDARAQLEQLQQAQSQNQADQVQALIECIDILLN